MKIVHISTLYYPFVGGIELAVQRIAEEQARLGNEVFVITSDFPAGEKTKMEVLNNVAVLRVKSRKSRYPYLISPRSIPVNILREADIVHGWGHTYYFVYKMIKTAKTLLKKPVVLYFIGVDYLKRHYNYLFRLLGYCYQKNLTKRLVKLIDLALVTNEHDKYLLKKHYNIESVVLPHGVDEVYIKIPNLAEEFRSKYGFYKQRIIAYIGRIHPTKGIDLLIEALPRIYEGIPEVILIIAGRGDEKYLSKCLEKAKKRNVDHIIKYLGYLTERDKIALIDASDVIVLPSRHAGESYPLIVEEVKARNKPLVVTDISPALVSIVSNYDEGYIVPRDPNAIAETILDILKRNKAIRKRLKRSATWHELASFMISLYNNSFF